MHVCYCNDELRFSLLIYSCNYEIAYVGHRTQFNLMWTQYAAKYWYKSSHFACSQPHFYGCINCQFLLITGVAASIKDQVSSRKSACKVVKQSLDIHIDCERFMINQSPVFVSDLLDEGAVDKWTRQNMRYLLALVINSPSRPSLLCVSRDLP